MNEAAREGKKGDSTPVLRFTAQLFRQPKTAKIGSVTLLNIPKWVSKKFPAHGETTIEGTINNHPFRTTLERSTSGNHFLRVNKAMHKGAHADLGDTVKLAILGPESELKVPADFRIAIETSREARLLWDDLTETGRRDWIRWIESAKTSETRTRRVTRAVAQLSVGKRRACCVNVYDYMLCRVRES